MKKKLKAKWKENKKLNEVTEWVVNFSTSSKYSENVYVIISPSFPYLSVASDLIARLSLKNVAVCGQDVSNYKTGSHTGEVSANFLKDFCEYCIVGHSERNEDRAIVNEKVKNCLDVGITPIVCFKNAVDFEGNFPKEPLLVWEDPSNISKEGEYKSPSHESISSEVTKIKGLLGEGRAIIYGGSVNSGNIEMLEGVGEFVGYLVGHASLDPEEFLKLVSNFFNKRI